VTTSQPFSGYDLTDVNGTLFFAADDRSTGKELWKSDGTLTGTVLVKDIIVGASASAPDNPYVWNDRLYFSASTSSTGRELWVSDGTDVDTVLIADLNPGTPSSSPSQFTASGSISMATSRPSFVSRAR
jgi:ELWxxDGT repeat protein